MAHGASKFPEAAFAICLVLLAVVGAVGVLTFRPPAPLGLDAPQEQFSAARARAELERLLGDQSPHPVGSDANKAIRARLVERLEQLGLPVEVQRTTACSFVYAVCGPIENVLARIAGDRDSIVLLMAHYDSVPAAPGAGDDGAAVAALLEIARILESQGPHRNAIAFAFTDGEEVGLLGAEAFFAEHAWAKQVAAVINLEGRGSSGPVLLIRSGPMSGGAMNLFRSVAPHPFAASMFEEVMKALPNDTDFSVSKRAGVPGFDFAFAGEPNHYHSPLDSIANLDPGTLQHHGDNVLPLVEALANTDLSVRVPNYVYANVTPWLWLAYSPASARIVAIVTVVLLVCATWRRWQGVSRFSGALGIVALTLILIGAFAYGAFALADVIAGTRVTWPAEDWPWRLLTYAIPVLVLALLRPLVHRIGFWSPLFAAWWLWCLLVLAQTWLVPLATHLMLPAALIASATIALLAFVPRLDRPAIRCAAALGIALVAGYFMLPLVYIGELAQGWALAPALVAPLALLAVTLLPLLDRGRVVAPFGAALLAFCAGLLWMNWAPLYSPARPQHLDFRYVVDADADRATYGALSPNPLPKRVQDVMPFQMQQSPLPWEAEDVKVATAPAAPVYRPATVLEPLAATGTTRRYRLMPGPSTNQLGFVIAKNQPVQAIRIAGHAVSLDPRHSHDYRSAYFVAPPADGVVIEVDAAADAAIDAYLIDVSIGLPPGGRVLVDARGALAAPVHSGDIWEIFRRVRL